MPKLTEGLNPSNYRLSDNQLYNSFYANIHSEIYSVTPDFKNDKYHFDINTKKWQTSDNQEIDFFLKNYFPVIGCQEYSQSIIDIKIPEKFNKMIGQVEQEILNFIFKGEHRLMITGKEGWGKTTLLRFIGNLIPYIENNDFYCCVPIYLSFNTHINKLAINLQNKDEIEKNEYYDNYFYGLLLNKIRYFTKEFLQSDITSNFYKFILNNSNFQEEQFTVENIENQCRKGWIDATERDKQWNNVREGLSKRKDTILMSFAYLREHNIEPLIIIDDLDPLNLDFHKYIYNESYYLGHENYKIKLILSMRPKINSKLEQITQKAIIINTRIHLVIPKLSEYLVNKQFQIKSRIVNMKKHDIIINNFKIVPPDIVHFFENYLDIISKSDSNKFILNISGGNMRVFNSLIHIFLRSGYVNTEKMISKIIASNSGGSYYIPQWITFSSILTYNHETVFGQASCDYVEDYKAIPVNILCNGMNTINPLLLRFHILSLFNSNEKFSFDKIVTLYKKVLGDVDDDEINKNLKRTIKRFKNGGLIGSYSCGYIYEYSDIKNNDEFYIEELGKYYFHQIVKIFEYLSFMKDDVNYACTLEEIKNNITVKNRFDRLKEVVKYIKHLFNEESSFIESLSKEQYIVYKERFAPKIDLNLLYTQVLCNNMIEYIKDRLSREISNEYNIEEVTVQNEIVETLKQEEIKLKDLLNECLLFIQKK